MTDTPDGWSAPGGEPPGPSAPPPAAAPPPAGYGYGTPPPGWQQPPPQPAWGQPQWGTPVVTPGVVPLRPLTLGEILDGAVKVVRRYPRPTLGMSALVAVVTTVLSLFAVLAQDYSSFAEDLRTSEGDGPAFTTGLGAGSNGVAGIPASVFGLLAGIVLTGFLVVVVGKAVLGQETTFAQTWQQVRPRIWALLGLALLVALVSGGPLTVAVLVAVALGLVSPVLLVIGIPLCVAAAAFAVYAYVRLSLSSAALVLEKAGIREAMRRSGVLVKGDWWRVLGILLLVQLISGLVTSVLTVPFLLVAAVNAASRPESGSFTLLFVVAQLGSGLATFLVAPFAAGARSLLYVDRRMRAEGLDLTLQAAARG